MRQEDSAERHPVRSTPRRCIPCVTFPSRGGRRRGVPRFRRFPGRACTMGGCAVERMAAGASAVRRRRIGGPWTTGNDRMPQGASDRVARARAARRGRATPTSALRTRTTTDMIRIRTGAQNPSRCSSAIPGRRRAARGARRRGSPRRSRAPLRDRWLCRTRVR